jgi:hypothetical protein
MISPYSPSLFSESSFGEVYFTIAAERPSLLKTETGRSREKTESVDQTLRINAKWLADPCSNYT